MNNTDMLLAGVSLETVLSESYLFETSSRKEFVESFHTRKEPLNESMIFSEDSFKPYKKEELYRDEEHGFVVYKEYSEVCPDGIDSAYNLDGKYIGSPKDAERICIDREIRPETFGDNNVCSIGFNDKEQAWYGWSHRAFSPGFKVGCVIDSPDHICLGCFGPNEKSVDLGFKAENLDDCKKLAIAYAYSVD